MSVIRVSDMCGQCKTDITIPPGNWGYDNPRDPKFRRWRLFLAEQHKAEKKDPKVTEKGLTPSPLLGYDAVISNTEE
jgi:hypothetical protein